MAKATTVRFTDEMFARLDEASARTGLPVNSIVVAACLEWMERHAPQRALALESLAVQSPAQPRWSTLRRAVVQAVGGRAYAPSYPFERFTAKARDLLTAAQAEATKGGTSYIGTEHLLLAAFSDPASHSALVLASLGVKEPGARTAILEVLGGKVPHGGRRIVPTARVKRVIEIAFDLCSAAGDPRVSTGHLLLALATEGDGVAAHALKEVGATLDRLRTELEKISEPEA